MPLNFDYVKKFNQLGLSNPILEVLQGLGFEQPTPIQEQTIPLLLSKDPTDFIGLAQTGTGKTAAFGLPLVDLIDSSSSHTQALILAPTRELGQQTAAQLKSFTANQKKLRVAVVYGGAAISVQIKELKKATQIVVATPGRLLDLIQRKAISLKNVEYVVLDEADEMLNMGFKEDIDKILDTIQSDHSIWLFSATMPKEIRKIVSKYMDNPEEVSVISAEKVNKDIAHKFVITKTANKVPAIRRFLDLMPEMRGILFCRTKRETQSIADDLGVLGYNVEALHGDLSQAQRDTVMRRFRTRSMQLLIATDVAARGIDVDELSHVMHHTLPDQLENYTHRSGRTARAGRKGVSIAFINPREEHKIRELERKVKVSFEKIEVPRADELKSKRMNNWADLIVNTRVDSQAADILEALQEKFGKLNKDDILKRLITTQLDHLMGQSGETEDLNETPGGKNNRSKEGQNRYFINVGTIDGVTKGDLIHFISDVSGIKRKSITDVSLQKNCAFFNVESSKDKGLSAKFDGIEVEGRSIRVNRDDEGPRDNHKNGPKKQFRGRGQRSHRGAKHARRRRRG